jgi:GNAT superfamily N-acetyltransferase
MIELQLLSNEQTRPFFDRLIDIYQFTFSQPPYHETLPDFFNFAGRLSYHAHQPGFRCVIACPDLTQPPVGFVYGYPGQKNSWFYNLAVKRLSPEMVREYLSNYFEFAELAVLPEWQGQGLGGRLHNAILAGLPQSTACLATPDIETPALHLYHRRSWISLVHGIDFANTTLKYQLMGKKLVTSQ